MRKKEDKEERKEGGGEGEEGGEGGGRESDSLCTSCIAGAATA